MKNKDCFKKLAKHLDDLPGGFPSTESGVEIRILHRLFTEEEARLAVHLILIPEEAAAIAKRAGITPEEAATRLEDMAKKGLISRYHPKGRKPKYMAAQFVIGIWEYHVNDLSPELIKDMDEYMPHLLDVKVWKKTPQLRTVPVGQSISVKHEVMAYENAEQLIQSNKRFLVAPCICRRERTMMGEGCDKPEEMCLIMGGAVHYYEENGLGCLINLEDALALLKKADKEGLVISPSNAKKIANICFCCGCCCGVLRTIKKHPKPAEIVSSPFIVSYDPSSCKGCEVCIDRCQMDAIKPDGDKIVVNLERCIGCGLCVTTCPTESFVLERKPEAEQTEVPDSLLQTYIKLGRERGKLNFIRLAGLWLRFKTKNLSAKK
jgi:Fe-S-cluster-containing hydrogenase component 2/DNA-binding Lrp family transcriptional regulator